MNAWLIAARSFRRKPAFTISAVLVLAVGVAAVMVAFSVGDVLVLRPLPWKNAASVVSIKEIRIPTSNSTGELTPADFIELQGATHTLDSVAAWIGISRTLQGGKFPEVENGVGCSASLFSLMGIVPELGRVYAPGAPDAVMISDALWRRQFDGDEKILGRSIQLDGKPYQIVGVLSADTAYPRHVDIWIPLRSFAFLFRLRQLPFFSVLGHLRQGTNIGMAQQESDAIASRLRQEHPGEEGGIVFTLEPFRRSFFGNELPVLGLLSVAAVILLALACINVMTILLAGALGRRREIAVHLALGADQSTLRRQFLREGLLLSFLGGITGVCLAPPLIRFVELLLPDEIVLRHGLGIDWRGALFALAVSVFCGLSFALMPTLVHGRAADLSKTLHGESPYHAGDRRSRNAWFLLVTAEVALTVCLCIGAGLLIKSFMRLTEVKLGLNPENVLSVRVSLPSPKYADNALKVSMAESLSASLSRLYGVKSVGIITFLPLSNTIAKSTVEIPGVSGIVNGEADAALEVVDESYFRTLQVPLLAGKFFSSVNAPAGPKVCLVNKAFATKYLSQINPVGETIRVGQAGEGYRILGVVGDTRADLARPPEPTIFLEYAQAPWSDFDIVLRTTVPPEQLINSARTTIWSLDSQLPLIRIMTLDRMLTDSLLDTRLRSWFASLYAALCLVLAGTGLYAVAAYSVRTRRREIAIRMSLGAGPARIFGWVLKTGSAPLAFGVVAGVLLSGLLGKLVSAFLYGVRPDDVGTLVLVTVFVLVSGMIPICVPAWHASRIQPARLLRYE